MTNDIHYGGYSFLGERVPTDELFPPRIVVDTKKLLLLLLNTIKVFITCASRAPNDIIIIIIIRHLFLSRYIVVRAYTTARVRILHTACEYSYARVSRAFLQEFPVLYNIVFSNSALCGPSVCGRGRFHTATEASAAARSELDGPTADFVIFAMSLFTDRHNATGQNVLLSGNATYRLNGRRPRVSPDSVGCSTGSTYLTG